MSLTELLILAIPAALVILKLTVVSLAVIWCIRTVLEPRRPSRAEHSRAPPISAGSRATRP